MTTDSPAATDPTPAAPDDLFGNTGVSYNNAQLITFACHAVANTVFVPLNPKPSWFDTLNGALVTAQGYAEDWIGTLGPQVTSTIPLQVINFNSNFQASTSAILQIAKDYPNAQGAHDPHVVQVKEIITDALLAPIEQVISNLNDVNGRLTTWGKNMQASHNDLSSGASSIQKAETQLSGDITAMNNAITNLNTEIADENKAIAASAAAIGVGIFALVVGIALAPETGGASLLIGGAIGAAGIIGGAVTWGVMQHRINENFASIAKDQAEKADDQRQIVALQGLATASSGAVANIENALQALSRLQTQWGLFKGELQGVVNDLDSAKDGLSTVIQGVFTSAAQTEWADATQTAQKLVNASPPIEAKTLPMDSQQAA